MWDSVSLTIMLHSSRFRELLSPGWLSCNIIFLTVYMRIDGWWGQCPGGWERGLSVRFECMKISAQELHGGELDPVQGRALEILSQSGLPSFFVLSVSILLAVLLQFLPSDCYVGCERS